MYVEEKNRSWCSSNGNNDNQAITIEVSNSKNGGNWPVSDYVLSRLIELCVDICKRNGIKELNYTGDANGNLTRHDMFADTTCPGPYLASKFPYIAEQVNKQLKSSQSSDTNKENTTTTYKVGDKVRFTGRLYRDSYGNGPGQTRTNLEATIYLVNPGAKCPYNINNGLGWVRAEDLKAITNSNNKYYTVVKGDTLSGIAARYNTTYMKLYELNKTLIDNENKKRGIDVNKMWLYPGQKLLLP